MSKKKTELAVAAFILGVIDAEGEALPEDVTRNHDWSKFLLAKSMYAERSFEGPDWVPFGLWSMSEPTGGDDLTRSIAKNLIFSPGAWELWASIEDLYDHPNSVSNTLPLELRGITEHWQRISKIKPAAHRDKMLRLKANALALAAELAKAEALDELLNGEKYDFLRLYDEKEQEIVFQNVAVYTLRNTVRGAEFQARKKLTLGEYMAPNDPQKPLSVINRSEASGDATALWELLLGDEDGWPGIVPDVKEILKRLAIRFEALAQKPAMQRPSHKNAERNFFAQRLCHYFINSCGVASPKIIATIVSMFYKQGITENEVSQMLSGVRAAYETSQLNRG